MGFASFVAGTWAKDNFEGGLLPVRMPPRKVIFKTSLITRMKMNKSNKVKMNKFKILSVAFWPRYPMNAQDIDQAKRRLTPNNLKMLNRL
jgi:hypothetical protein